MTGIGKMKIGILGGSFDPIHNAHMHMAVCSYHSFELDEVWLIPAGHSPNKNEAGMADSMHRLRMCEIAASSDPHIKACSIEVDSRERSYTYRTLEKLHELYPEHTFYFIMGGDSLDYFDRWVMPERICELATLLVVPRDEFHAKTLLAKMEELKGLFCCDIRIVPCERYHLSSTQIRQSLKSNTVHEGDFPPGVLDYIRENGLYIK